MRRRRRSTLQRWLWRDTDVARFRCVSSSCGWTGLLATRLDADADAAPSPGWRRRTLRGVVPLLLAGLAVAAAQWGASLAPVASVAVGARHFAPGEAFDGDVMPSDHPLLTPAVLELAPSAGAHDDPPATRSAPLSLRRFCAWGRPGRMPFQGSAEEALAAARLPRAARDQIVAAIAARRPHDRLVITNDAIRTASGKRTFAANGIAMTYGRTLCLGTRVNFRPGHAEPASLYEAFDNEGRRYSVMVPDVCGNVSVLWSDEDDGPRTASASGAPSAGQDPLDPGLPAIRTLHAEASGKPNEVPTPGTLALTVLALAAAWGARKRRQPDADGGTDSGPPAAGRRGGPH